MDHSLFYGTMANMKWTDIQEKVRCNAVVLLPIGVIEEHGPHLCLGTDIYTALMQCRYVQDDWQDHGVESVIAPPFYWGVCQSTTGFPGSFTARIETVSAMLQDILTSLGAFGFRHVCGINAHGDIDHNIAVLDAFRAVDGLSGMDARYVFNKERLEPFGLTGLESYLCVMGPPDKPVSRSKVPDIHAGDVETATMHTFFPQWTDVDKARSLPPVALEEPEVMQWLFGGHAARLSPDGYLGAPAEFMDVDVEAYLRDTARRIAFAMEPYLT